MKMNRIETTTIVAFDDLGRLLIPKKVREMFNARKFKLESSVDEIVLRPIKTIDDLFGTLPKLSTKGLKEDHEDEHFA
ncbi:MAG: AbrB family transcriptional regulator [Candidatus Micrarchaeota archaeon]